MSVIQKVTRSSLEQNIINTAIDEWITIMDTQHLRTCLNRNC